MRALVFVSLLAACGGRLDTPSSGDASITDSVPCSDAGACSASTDYCSAVYADGGASFACTTLPPKCHACACAAPPKIGFICSCTSDGDQILVSCTKE